MTSASFSILSAVSLAFIVALIGAAMTWRARGRRAVESGQIEAVATNTENAGSEPARRIAAISGADSRYGVSIRSVARQAAPYHTRPVERMPRLSAVQLPVAVPLALVARRPGLAKQSTRIERRLAVVR
jgi:hypothetical protein